MADDTPKTIDTEELTRPTLVVVIASVQFFFATLLLVPTIGMWALILFNALSKRETFDPSFTLAAVLVTIALGLLTAGGTGLMRMAPWGRLLSPLALLVFFSVIGYISANLQQLHHRPLTALIPFGIIGLVVILAAIFGLTRPHIVAAFARR